MNACELPKCTESLSMPRVSDRKRAGVNSVVLRLGRGLGSPWVLGVADQVAISAANFLCGLIIARTTSPAQFGLFTLGMTVIYLLQDVQASLVSTPQAIRSPGIAADKLKNFTGSTLVHQGALSALSVGVVGVFAAFSAAMSANDSGLSLVLAVIALFGIFTLLREYCRRLCFLRGWMVRVVAFDVVVAFSQIAALLAVAFWHMVSAPVAHAAMGLVCAFFAVPFLLMVRNQFSFSWQSIWPDFKANTRIGGWLLASSLSWSIGIYAYPWLLAMMHGAKDTGILAACMGIIAIMNVALIGILNVLTPSLARAHAEGGMLALRQHVFRACRNYVGLALALASIPILFGGTLITLIYGPTYAGTHFIVSVLALNSVFGAVMACFGRGLIVIGRANLDFAFNLGTLIIVFTVGWWSTAVYGPLGAAIGLMVANGLTALLRFMAFEIISKRFMPG